MEKKKFKLKTKVGQVVYSIQVNIRSNADKFNQSCSNKEGIHVEKLRIVYQTKYKIALSNDWITVLSRQTADARKESYNSYLDSINVCIKTQETYFPNGIFASCYSLENPEKCISKIKKEIIKKIENDYGFLRDMNIEKTINDFTINHI